MAHEPEIFTIWSLTGKKTQKTPAPWQREPSQGKEDFKQGGRGRPKQRRRRHGWHAGWSLKRGRLRVGLLSHRQRSPLVRVPSSAPLPALDATFEMLLEQLKHWAIHVSHPHCFLI